MEMESKPERAVLNNNEARLLVDIGTSTVTEHAWDHRRIGTVVQIQRIFIELVQDNRQVVHRIVALNLTQLLLLPRSLNFVVSTLEAELRESSTAGVPNRVPARSRPP